MPTEKDNAVRRGKLVTTTSESDVQRSSAVGHCSTAFNKHHGENEMIEFRFNRQATK